MTTEKKKENYIVIILIKKKKKFICSFGNHVINFPIGQVILFKKVYSIQNKKQLVISA
jgi:hypothetical protein